MRFDVGGVDHLRIRRSSTPGQFPEQGFPDATPRPVHEPVIDRHVWAILGRAIAPATAALENMHDPADNPAIINPLHTANLSKTNQDRIVGAQELMSSNPNAELGKGGLP